MIRQSYPLSLITAVILSTAVLTSCESDTPEHEPESTMKIDDSHDVNAQDRVEKVENIFYTIPSPIEMASLIQKSGADFDKSILNPIESAANFTTSKQQALNLGVYGADLSYTSIFDQNQESIYYLSAAQKLAKELGVENAIDNKTFERINNNMENRDSLLHIVSDAYWSLNGYLKEDNREDISALVIAGGWVEGLYLAAKHAEGSDKLKERIAEQKYSLGDLIALMQSYEGSDALASVIIDLQNVQASYDKLTINKEKTETSKDESGTMVIGGKSEVAMTDEQLAEIVGKITTIRNAYIQ